MRKHPFSNGVTKAGLGCICAEHRQLRVLLGKLESSRVVQEQISLLGRFDEAFVQHGMQELDVLNNAAFEDADQFIENDNRHHSTIDDLLFMLGKTELSIENVRASASLIREQMNRHMFDEERYLHARIVLNSTSAPSAAPVPGMRFKVKEAVRCPIVSGVTPKLVLVISRSRRPGMIETLDD